MLKTFKRARLTRHIVSATLFAGSQRWMDQRHEFGMVETFKSLPAGRCTIGASAHRANSLRGLARRARRWRVLLTPTGRTIRRSSRRARAASAETSRRISATRIASLSGVDGGVTDAIDM